jgi:hypothetical protein
LSYDDEGILGYTFDYQVRAKGSGDGYVSAPSNVVSATVPTERPQAMIPTAPPSSLTVTPTGTDTLTLTWVDNNDADPYPCSNEIGFRIERRMPDDPTSTFMMLTETAADVTTYDDPVLPFVAYEYRVIAFGAFGNSDDYSNIAAGKCTGDLPASVSDVVAQSLSPAGGLTSVVLGWTDNANNEAGVRVERFDGSTWSVVGTAAADATTLQVDGFTAYAHELLRLIAFNDAGDATPVEVFAWVAYVDREQVTRAAVEPVSLVMEQSGLKYYVGTAGKVIGYSFDTQATETILDYAQSASVVFTLDASHRLWAARFEPTATLGQSMLKACRWLWDGVGSAWGTAVCDDLGTHTTADATARPLPGVRVEGDTLRLIHAEDAGTPGVTQLSYHSYTINGSGVRTVHEYTVADGLSDVRSAYVLSGTTEAFLANVGEKLWVYTYNLTDWTPTDALIDAVALGVDQSQATELVAYAAKSGGLVVRTFDGTTWGTPTNLASAAGPIRYVAVARDDGGDAHLVYATAAEVHVVHGALTTPQAGRVGSRAGHLYSGPVAIVAQGLPSPMIVTWDVTTPSAPVAVFSYPKPY